MARKVRCSSGSLQVGKAKILASAPGTRLLNRCLIHLHHTKPPFRKEKQGRASAVAAIAGRPARCGCRRENQTWQLLRRTKPGRIRINKLWRGLESGSRGHHHMPGVSPLDLGFGRYGCGMLEKLSGWDSLAACTFNRPLSCNQDWAMHRGSAYEDERTNTTSS
jgi:hypothetical protein